MSTKGNNSSAVTLVPRSSLVARRGFTLVELLVVITIIGILAGLITVAAVGALKSARQTEIKAEINQIDTAFMEYKNKTTAFPPNCQTDDTTAASGAEPPDTPLSELQVFNDLKRHMKQAFPRHQESDNLLRAIAGLPKQNSDPNFDQLLGGGMSAGEAIVFWLGGFSSDPKYPISGEGGPAYAIQGLSQSENRTRDPVESRKWLFPFEVGRLGPRDEADGYFSGRSIEYIATINGQRQPRRINFWQYTPRRSQQPYLYFDTSRHKPYPASDPPAATEVSGLGLHVHALKKKVDSTAIAAATMLPIQFVDPEKFQVLHCGLDEAWDEEAFERMSYHAVKLELNLPPEDPDSYLLFPTGPFTGDIADTIVNFITETKIEDAQP